MGQYFSKPKSADAPDDEAAQREPQAATASVEAKDQIFSPSAVDGSSLLPPDVAAILEDGHDRVRDAPPLPSLQEATQALRAKYFDGQNQADTASSPDPQSSEAQEARLRALLKGKRKAQSNESSVQSKVIHSTAQYVPCHRKPNLRKFRIC